MQTFIRGNTVMVQTNISEEDYEKYKSYGVFTVKDDKGQDVYAVKRTNQPDAYSSISEFGIVCDTVYQGKLTAASLFNGEPQEFLDNYLNPRLLALKENEQKISENLAALKVRLEGIENSVLIED